MDCFAALAMTAVRHAFTFSRLDTPELCQKLSALSSRGRREDRVRAAPAISWATCTKKCAHEHTGPAENTRPSLRNGFTAYNVISPENGSFASVAPWEVRCLPGAWTPASLRQDHTSLPYASAALVKRQPQRPPLPAQRP